MMLSCAINSKENRYVVVFDIPRAFLNANLNDNVHMLLEGTIAEMISSLDPTIYSKYILYNKQSNYLALYETIQAAILFWKLLAETLQEWGFTLNHYERFITNKNFNGKQCTIIWNVYDQIYHTLKMMFWNTNLKN